MITLRADAHTPANLLRLAPVAYWSERFPPLTRRAAFNSLAAAAYLFRQASDAGITSVEGAYRQSRT